MSIEKSLNKNLKHVLKFEFICGRMLLSEKIN